MVTLLAGRLEGSGTSMKRVLPDDASEFYHYEDNGCEASDSCLDCPLPKCKYDDPVWYQRNRRLARDFRIVTTMERDCLSIEEAAERFSVTTRTVFRIVQRCREAAYPGTVCDSATAQMAA